MRPGRPIGEGMVGMKVDWVAKMLADARLPGGMPCGNFRPDFVSIDCICGHPINEHVSSVEVAAETPRKFTAR